MSAFLAVFVRVPELAAQHLLVSAAALLLGLVIALPLIVLSARRPAIGRVALGFASLIQTIPALALLALFFPVLLWLSGLVGGRISALGFLPAFLALALYALLPILRNGVTGLASLDPDVLEAADGIGMTAGQRLRWVEAPLVLPVLMAGIRTAAVWTIGAATLSTAVGQPSLGDLIFTGLQIQDWSLVLAGCVAAAALALGVDALLALAERGIARRRPVWTWLALGLLGTALLLAAAVLRPAAGGRHVTVGAKDFSEQFILARVIGHRLERAGYTVSYREGLGSSVIFNALASDDIGVYVDYSGTIWTGQMHRADTPKRAAMTAAIGTWAKRERGVALVGSLGFENAYALAMRGSDAQRRHIATLDDLAAASPQLKLGADLEFLERPEWAALRRVYPFRFASAQGYAPTFMYDALASGQADVISAFSSDGRIAAEHLAVLADPRGAIPAYDAILLLSPRLAKDPRAIAALRPLIERIPVKAMREANYLLDRPAAKRSPEQAARWLEEQLGL